MSEPLNKLSFTIGAAPYNALDDAIARALLDVLADFDRRLRALEATSYVGPVGPGGSVEDCNAHVCSYYVHYLAYGPPDLVHEGFHSAEDGFLKHSECCTHWERGQVCQVCIGYEKRLRS